MKQLTILAMLLAAAGIVMSAHHESAVHPAIMTSAEVAGTIFERPDMVETTRNGNTTLDVTSLMSSDKKFASGMYRSGKVRFEIQQPYGVDEFMYFLEGGVTLTSSDGHITAVTAGDAVTIPKEWTGVWDTEGYTKIWVIYSEDGSGLE